MAEVKAEHVYLCRVAGNTVWCSYGRWRSVGLRRLSYKASFPRGVLPFLSYFCAIFFFFIDFSVCYQPDRYHKQNPRARLSTARGYHADKKRTKKPSDLDLWPMTSGGSTLGPEGTGPPNLAHPPKFFQCNLGLTCLHQFILYCTI